MIKVRQARLDYFQGVRSGLDEHMATTERYIRGLPGVDERKMEKLLQSVRKRHDKLLRQLDREIAALDR